MVGSSVTGTVLSTASAYSASLVKIILTFSVSRQSSLKLPEKKQTYLAESFFLSLWIIEAFSSEKELSVASWRSTAQGPLLFQMKVMLKLWKPNFCHVWQAHFCIAFASRSKKQEDVKGWKKLSRHFKWCQC